MTEARVDDPGTQEPSPLRQTPLHGRHREAGATMADFGGWDMPIEYSGTLDEHACVRESVGVFDVSHMGYTEISGPHAAEWLNTVLTNDLTRIGSGEAQYTLLCNDSGGVVDDLLVYRVDDDNLFIVPNAANSDAVVGVLEGAAPDGVAIRDRRDGFGILAVQGPRSETVLADLGLPHSHDYMSFERTRWRDHPIVIARTGYTGERGYELLISNDGLGDLWDAVVAAGAKPCGLGARDTLRTEMGYPLHGHELSSDITPVQARLGWAVGWDKPQFAGVEVLRAERADGPRRVLRALKATGRGVPRPGMTVRDADGHEIGVTTSGTFSPTLKTGIALALVDPGVSVDDEVVIDVRKRALPCIITAAPFVPSHVR